MTPDTSEGPTPEAGTDDWLLVRLLPTQVAEQWDVLKEAVKLSLPPPMAHDVPGVLNNMLQAFLLGNLVCWLGGKYESGEFKSHCMITTGNMSDFGNLESYLLIYCAYAYAPITTALWQVIIYTLRAHAKAQRYSYIVGFTSSNSFKSVITSIMSGNVDWTFFQVEV